MVILGIIALYRNSNHEIKIIKNVSKRDSYDSYDNYDNYEKICENKHKL
jgi:hypothetical protein